MLHLELDSRLTKMSEEIGTILSHPPHTLSMLNGNNYYNNKIDWDKETQRFSNDWISWRSGRGVLSLDNTGSALEFALGSSQTFFVQPELSSKGHIDLALGDDCYCAGTFHFDREGYIEAIHLDSGHYQPEVEHGKFLIALLLSRYNLSTKAGQENFKYFLDHVKVHIYNRNTNSFDVCLADDLMTGKYEASLRQTVQRGEREEHKKRYEEEALEDLEKLEEMAPYTKLIDALIKFNALELSRLNGQSPLTGKDDHKAKVDAFTALLKNLRNFALDITNINETDLKAQIKLFLTRTEAACNMRTHKNMDTMTGSVARFFNKTPGPSTSQKNYAAFVKENKPLIDKVKADSRPVYKF